MAPIVKNCRKYRVIRYIMNRIIRAYLYQGWLFLPQEIIFVKLAITDAVPNSAPFIHRLRYFIKTIMLGGPSVKAFASGM